MKKIFLTAAMLLVLGISYAQDTGLRDELTGENIVIDYELPMSTDNTVTATNEIRLKPGFRARHSGNFQTSLKIDDFGVYPPEAGLTGGPVAGSDGVVGAIGGTVDVSALGGATYTIPIEVPAGVNGMHPVLAVSYNSQGGSGLLGYGWDLSGFSSITRTGSTLYHDGRMTAADFSGDDRFLLDGQRLIKVSDGNGSVEYKTEQDEFSKIVFYKDGDEFSRCVVWQSDGNIIHYGSGDNSRLMTADGAHVIKWMANRVEDRNGNAMEYSYINDPKTGEIYISGIDYTINEKAKVDAEFRVVFGYRKNDRYDRKSYYIHGNKVQENKLLETITVTRKTGNMQMLKYDFTYNETGYGDYDDMKMFTRLVEVGLTKDGVSLNPTRISWTGANMNSILTENILAISPNDSIYDRFMFVGDFNGDGYSDIATVPFKEDGIYNDTVYPDGVDLNVHLNTKNGKFDDTPVSTLKLSRELDWVYVADMNDDGYDDLLVVLNIDEDPDSTGVVFKVVLYENKSGKDFEETLQIDFDKPVTNVVVGDFIGDNSISALISTSYSMAYRFVCQKNGKYYVHGIRLPSLMHPDYCYGGDFNGDGITEVLLVYPEKSMIYEIEGDFYTYSPTTLTFTKTLADCDEIRSGNYVFPGDINGDGKTDLMYYDHSMARRLKTFMSDGVEFRRSKDMLFGNLVLPYCNIYDHSLSKVEKSPLCTMTVADVDGNGQTDVLYFARANSTSNLHLFVYYNFDENTGSFTSSYSPPGNVSHGGVVDCHTQYFNMGYFCKRDNLSFITLRKRLITGNEFETRHVTMSIASSSALYSVKSVTDGLGNSTGIAYDYVVTDHSKYEYMSKFGVRPVPVPLMVVKSFTAKNAGGKDNVKSFSFSNAMFHRYGRGCLGFENVRTTDTINGDLVGGKSSWFDLDVLGYNAGLLPTVDSTFVYIDGKQIVSETNTYKFDKVTCSREESNGVSHIIRPAMVNNRTCEFDIDNPGRMLTQSVMNYVYTYNAGKYNDTYCCISESCGVDGNQDKAESYKHYTVTETGFFADDLDNWVINRKMSEKSRISMKGKKDIYNMTHIEYCSSNPFLVKSVRNIPSLQYNDELSTMVSFEYDEAGNVTMKNVTAPNGSKGEQPGKVKLVYYDSKRLIKEKITDPDNLAYKESYEYDSRDRVFQVTDAAGLVTGYGYDDAFGSTVTITNPDGTKTVEARRWSDGHELNPDNGVFYKWSKTTGGITTFSFMNGLGDVLRAVTYDNKLNAVMADNEYDDMGRVMRQSQPHAADDTVAWNTVNYDNIGRVVMTESANGVKVSYGYNGYETTMTTEADGMKRTTSRKTNSLGWLEYSIDENGAKVTYDYYADGNIAKAITSGGKVKLELEYDNAGNKTVMKDSDYGTASYTYDAYGRLLHQTSPKGLTTAYEYDILSRLVTKVDKGEGTKTSFKYNEKEHKGTLWMIIHEGQIVRYDYDEIHRPVKVTEMIEGKAYFTELSYDEASRVSSLKYPSGYSVNYGYYSNGHKHTVTDAEGNLLWRTDDVNAMGQLLKATVGNGLVTENKYNDKTHELLGSVTSKNIQNFSYSYDKFGNLAARTDSINNVEETFTYDSINRLTGITLKGGPYSEMVYDKLGRMVKKQMDGKTVFEEAAFRADKPHAIATATADPGLFDTKQEIKYTSFDKVSAISQSVGTVSYTYGYDEQRLTMREETDAVKRTKTYVGACEFITENGREKVLTYLTGPYGVFAVIVSDDSGETLHYIHKDHLGSWTTITDADGKVEQRQSFDAWGNRRNARTWYGFPDEIPLFDRGYTGHEHLYAFGLINMNGRVYDPTTSSFLSPDNYVQDPTSQQGFNRYAYCGYNPLKYTDPTGERRCGLSEAEIMYLDEQMAKQNAWREWGIICMGNDVKHKSTVNGALSIYTWGDNKTGGGHDYSGTGNGKKGGFNLSKLTDSQRKAFVDANNYFCTSSKLYNTIFNAVNNCGKDIYIEIDESLECPGIFDDKNNTIKYRSVTDMVDFYTGTEEIIHAYQKAVNGCLYSDDLDFNYEFEAKTIKACVAMDIPGLFGATPDMEAMNNYLLDCEFGNMSNNSADVFLNNYMRMAYDFMIYHINAMDKSYRMPTYQNPQSIIELKLFDLW